MRLAYVGGNRNVFANFFGQMTAQDPKVQALIKAMLNSMEAHGPSPGDGDEDSAPARGDTASPKDEL